MHVAALRRRGFRFRRPPRLHPNYEFDPTRSATFRGVGRIRLFQTAIPLFKITVDRRWIRTGGFAVPTVWIPREPVTSVTSFRFRGATLAHFATHDGAYDGVLIGDRGSVWFLKTLANFGWPVEGEVVNEPGVVCWRCREPSARTDHFCQKCGTRLRND
jgi:hypothetical protein